MELLARVYDHVEHKYQKGFTLLTLGWSDCYSFSLVGFNLLSSAKKSYRYQEISDKIDHRTNGYKARKESSGQTECATFNCGNYADLYVLTAAKTFSVLLS